LDCIDIEDLLALPVVFIFDSLAQEAFFAETSLFLLDRFLEIQG
jgi:hypothetical protein